ncbi:MAG: transketolase [Candidatus Cloacimonadota bacterium]|nr:MAG: transketolase [Candidatus Cloacimonadota bacterium]
MRKTKKSGLLKDWFIKQPDYLFKSEKLSLSTMKRFDTLGKIIRGDILTMTTVADSGHPGGSMSSADIYIVVYGLANIHPSKIDNPTRDRIVVSHGHTSAGVYSILGRLGFFNVENTLTNFRRCGSIFEGHVERSVPGCEWSTGNLGQGLSAGCGFALASKIHERDYNVFVLMSDGEQAKGQISEARRFARKFNLNNITVLIDYNELQITGSVHEIMEVKIKENYTADGWKVIELDGHNYEEIYSAIRKSINDSSSPYAILCHTTMGKSVSFMENVVKYHGSPLSPDECCKALIEIDIEEKIGFYKKKRKESNLPMVKKKRYSAPLIIGTNKPLNYEVTAQMGNRDAFGKALENIALINKEMKNSSPIVALDCDLKESVRTHLFEKIAPEWFIEGGVQEHNTATLAGVLSIEGILTFFADFGVFGIDEVYNQQRLNAINHTNLKVIITHSGINVGQDGKTHHCIDFLGLARNIPGFKVIIPADPNQTDRVIRYISKEEGNFLVVTGRTKNPIVADSIGRPFFGGDYDFNYGKVDVVREGENGVIMTYGSSLIEALLSWEELKREGINFDIWNISTPLSLTLKDIEKAIFKGPIFTFEDHLVYSGLGTIVGNLIAETGMGTIFKKIGVTDFAPSGFTRALYGAMGIDSASLTREVRKIVGSRQ